MSNIIHIYIYNIHIFIIYIYNHIYICIHLLILAMIYFTCLSRLLSKSDERLEGWNGNGTHWQEKALDKKFALEVLEKGWLPCIFFIGVDEKPPTSTGNGVLDPPKKLEKHHQFQRFLEFSSLFGEMIPF